MSGDFFRWPRAVSSIGIVFIWLGLMPSAWAQTYLIDSLGDEGLANLNSISCVSTAGTCTLRSAIQANNNRTSTSATLDFSSIPVNGDGDGVSSVIRPNSPLPAINRPITIAGETHPNFNPDNGFQRVQLDGSNVAVLSTGLAVNSGGANSVIRHLSVRNFRSHGMSVSADGVILQGNRLGTYHLGTLDASGPTAGNEGYGLRVGNSNGSQILDNVITDNDSGGIWLTSNARNTLMAGNQIGVQLGLSGGILATGNGGPGILFQSTAGSGNEVGRCQVIAGISNFCRGNLIVANGGHGIDIAAPGQSVVFNTIGVNLDNPSNAAFGNAGVGIRIAASDVFVGPGVAPGGVNTANTIAHSGEEGVLIASGNDNTISANRVGGLPDGTVFGNTGNGIRILAGSNHSVTGNLVTANANFGIRSASGPTSISNNEVIGNGGVGIRVTDWRHIVEGNVVGEHGIFGISLLYTAGVTDATEVRNNWVGVRPNGEAIPNGNGIAVGAFTGSPGTAIIGGGVGDGNVIAGNTFDGLILQSSEGSSVRSNFIGVMPDGTARGNGRYGININGGGDSISSANAILIGYGTVQSIPAHHVPDGTGAGGFGNIIAHNAVGVRVSRSDPAASVERNRIRGNRIYANSDGGIQIFSTIGSINEGAGEGPNRLLNHPQLDDNATFFDSSNGSVGYRVRVPTLTSAATYPLRIDFYLTDPGESQGRFYLGSVEYPAEVANTWVSGSFMPLGGYDLAEAMMVAMATDNQGNSSEFSASPADLSAGSPSPLDGIVISTAMDQPNADPDSTACDTGVPFQAPGVPTCSLRAAIQAANNSTEPVTITFWEGILATSGVTTFSPTSELPPIGSNVTLAGETHPDFNPANGPSVVISGTNLSGADRLLRMVSASNSEIRHVALINSPTSGLRIDGGSNLVFRDNLVGLRPQNGAFVAAGNNLDGVVVNSVSGMLIDNNWIADNGERGIIMQASTSQAVVVGNVIGAGRLANGSLNPAGNNRGVDIIGNAGTGIHIGQCTGLPPNQVCQGNVIVANGIGINVQNNGVSMASNWVGVNPDDPADENFGHASIGVRLFGENHQLTSGLVIGQGANVIGHGGSSAILLQGSGHVIAGAFVGVTPGGVDIGAPTTAIRIDEGSGHEIVSSRIANHSIGVRVASTGNRVASSHLLDHSAHGIQILAGGQVIEDNVIGGNQQTGVVYSHPFDTSPDGLIEFYRNRIGVDQDDQPRPNGTGLFGMGAGRTDIGGDDGDGNIIAFNQERGIGLATGRSNRIRGNWIGVLPDGTPAGNGAIGVLITTGTAGPNTLDNVVGYGGTASIPTNHADGSVGAFGNIIGHQPTGILVNSSDSSAVILRNSLRGNHFVATGVPVQLGDSSGGTDPGGSQTGPNRLQNPPEFNLAGMDLDATTNTVTFSVRVDTLATNANYPIRIDIYHVVDGQPDRLLHTETYSSGSATEFVSGSFAVPAGLLSVSDRLIGMATDDAGNSSEFSQPVGLGERDDLIFTDRFE